VQGTHLAELAVPEMEERVESLLDSCLGGARRISEEVRMQHAGGDSFWGELVLLPVNGREDCVEGVLRDVTDRKMAEAIRAIVTGETDL
jgi:PAS domain S-box-containing protein